GLLVIGLIWIGQGGMQQLTRAGTEEVALSSLRVEREEVLDEQAFNQFVVASLDRVAHEDRLAGLQEGPQDDAARFLAGGRQGGFGGNRGDWRDVAGGLAGEGNGQGAGRGVNGAFGLGAPGAPMNRPQDPAGWAFKNDQAKLGDGAAYN